MRLLYCLLGCLAFASAQAQVSAVHHDLSVTLEPGSRELSVSGKVRFTGSGMAELRLAPEFTLQRLTLDGKPLSETKMRGALIGGLRVRTLALGNKPAAHMLELQYRGTLAPLAQADRREALGNLPAMADERGSYLPASYAWYPDLGTETLTYTLALDVPATQRAIAPGRLVKETTRGNRYRARFEFSRPAEGVTLMAGPYRTKEIKYKNLRLRTYFHPEIAELADEYLNSISGYIELYNGWIGAYPYTAFSIVSSPLPTGYGMPTLTYLGIEVLRLPFIRHRSLGHEILHNWWGNGVYADWRCGNWSEGLTTFMADYTYKERQSAGAARAQRLSWLRDFAAIPEGQDIPLRDFTSRHHSASQTIGYHKAAFLFFMLRDQLGADAFNRGLRRFWKEQQFRVAGWADLQRAFEPASGKKLDIFFAQWLTRRGAPQPVIHDAQITQQNGRHRIAVTLAQPAPAYALRVPLVVTTAGGKQEHIVELNRERQHYTLESASRPLSLALDPDLRLFRRLDAAELPPILRQVINDPATLTVITEQDSAFQEAARRLAERLLDHAPRYIVQYDRAQTLLLIGTHQAAQEFLLKHKLPAQPATLRGKGSAQVWAARQDGGKTLLVVSADDSAALEALLRPLPHYGSESYLAFDGGKVIERGVWPAPSREWLFPAH
ncbi:MAG: M1 family peptidase [Gammaproteobacteria bacterium]|nr:MAG: M1 family peptidase [Gammaproteobacteria bacterium]